MKETRINHDQEREELLCRSDETEPVLGGECPTGGIDLWATPDNTLLPQLCSCALCGEAIGEVLLRRCIRNGEKCAVRIMTPSADDPFWKEEYEGEALDLKENYSEKEVIDELKRNKTLLPWHHKYYSFKLALNYALGERPWGGELMQSDVERGCDGTLRHTNRLLKMIPGIAIDSSLSALTGRGGTCDCQVFLTAIPQLEEDVDKDSEGDNA